MKLFITGLACLGLFLAPALQAKAKVKQNKKTAPVHDVTLNDSGALQGLVVDAQGKSLGGAQVAVLRDNKKVTTVVADREGKFEIANLSTGIYELKAGQGQGVVRVWASKVAPPSAKSRVLLVNGATARAQAGLFEQPRVIDYAILGAAITAAVLAGTSDGDTTTIIVSP